MKQIRTFAYSKTYKLCLVVGFLFIQNLPSNAQQAFSKTNAVADKEILKTDETIISVTHYENKLPNTPISKPVLITAEDKKLWTRPVYLNPNYHKVMPLRSPNEVDVEDKD